MKTTADQQMLISADVLEALGLERRHKGRDVALAVGFVTAGALVGAGFVLLRAGLNSISNRHPAPPAEAAES